MIKTELEPIETLVLDSGRLQVNARFVDLLRQHELCGFEALWNVARARDVRRVPGRSTVELAIDGAKGTCRLFLKRFEKAPLRERLMPWLHGKPAIWGAAHEWDAIVRFRAAGLPTVTPVALGTCGGRSLLVTLALEGAQSLLDWVARQAPLGGASAQEAFARDLRTLTVEVAQIARQMHRLGWHHQDFYLNHLLRCGNGSVHVIDLGRARQHRHLARRWMIKDLAQLDFSARNLPCKARLRFLHAYLGRKLDRRDRRLIGRILAKSRRIARHTARHGL